MKMISSRLVLSFFMIATLAWTMTCGTKPEDKVKAFEETYNSHDVEKIMSFYADDAVHEVPGTFLLKGKKEFRDLAEYDKTLNFHLSFKQCTVKADTITCELTVTDDWTRTAGIQKVTYSSKIEFRDGLIKQWITVPTPESAQEINNLVRGLIEYASKEKPQLLKEMMPEGKFIYNAENARKLLALEQEWKATY